MHYFGPWADSDAALAKYLDQKDALHAGRNPRPEAAAMMVKDLANAFLNAKSALLDAGELSPHTWANYKRIADTLVDHMGKTRLVADLDTQDFAALRNQLAKKCGPHRLAVTIQHIRSIFKHALDAGLIPMPVRFGPGFKRPSKKTFRLHRAGQGAKLFAAEELCKVLSAASMPMKAMILLGVNCGLGNSDSGNLPVSAIDFDGGWLDYPRPMPGINRRCPLWPETIDALREALANRPDPKNEEHTGLLFVTKYGLPWAASPTMLDANGQPIRVGSGGLGVVYRGRELNPVRPVAIKFLHSGHDLSDEERQRFAREVEAAARLRHPNVVQVIKAGAVEGRQYYVMELVHGGDLAELIRRGPIDPRTAATWLAKVVRAIFLRRLIAVIG